MEASDQLGRDVDDVALLQQVIAGPDRRDATASSQPAPELLTTLHSGIAQLRIAWSADFGRIPIDSRIVATGRDALEAATGAGASVEEIAGIVHHPWGDGAMLADLQAAVGAGSWDSDDGPAEIPDTTTDQQWMWTAFSGLVPLTATPEFQALCQRHRHLLTPPSQLSTHRAASTAPPTAKQPTTEELNSTMTALLDEHDVICSPTMATVAPVVPAGWATPYADSYMGTNFTFIANATGCPAATIPCGLVAGLPVGLQIIGRPGDEATVLRVCHALEAAIPAPARPNPTG